MAVSALYPCERAIASTSKVIFGLILSIFRLHTAHSWVVLSNQNSTQLALGSNVDPASGKLVTTGVLFQTASNNITAQSCYIALGDRSGFDRALYRTPQLCTHFEIFPRPKSDASVVGTPSLPFGLVAGIYRNQPMMGSIDFSGEIQFNSVQFNLPWTKGYDLPAQTFPVSVSSDEAGGVYVGLHPTAESLPARSTQDPNQDLQNIYDYYKRMTDPRLVEHFNSPQVVKVNMITHELQWELVLETRMGKSTIGNVLHVASRDLLVVAGSSSGRGMLVGALEFSTGWDGYITLVNATTGEVDVSSASQTHLSADFSMRVQSQVGQNDYILGACALDEIIFLLGTTTGKFKADDGNSKDGGGAFVIMLDIDTLNIQWTQQWYGPGAEALKCIATPTSVFVAGHVPEGVSLQEDDTRIPQTPSKDQDIFVSVLDIANGNMKWTRQVDSRLPDYLADIQLSRSGDLIFTGNSMDSGVSDVYTASMSQDGFYDWIGYPPEGDPIPGDTNGGNGQTLPHGEDNSNTTVVVVATIVPFVLFMGVMAIINRKKPTPAETNDTCTSRSTDVDGVEVVVPSIV